jgi:hypothetical protein
MGLSGDGGCVARVVGGVAVHPGDRPAGRWWFYSAECRRDAGRPATPQNALMTKTNACAPTSWAETPVTPRGRDEHDGADLSELRPGLFCGVPSELAGRICAEQISPCPPGFPCCRPGNGACHRLAPAGASRCRGGGDGREGPWTQARRRQARGSSARGSSCTIYGPLRVAGPSFCRTRSGHGA